MDVKKTSKRRLLVGTSLIALGAVPTRWTAPVVNSVLLPVHASTSQASLACEAPGLWTVTDTSAGENDPGAPLVLNSDGSGTYNGNEPVSWSIADNVVTLSFDFNQSIAALIGTMRADCGAFSGNWDNAVTGASGTWTATRATTTANRQAVQATRKPSPRAFR